MSSRVESYTAVVVVLAPRIFVLRVEEMYASLEVGTLLESSVVVAVIRWCMLSVKARSADVELEIMFGGRGDNLSGVVRNDNRSFIVSRLQPLSLYLVEQRSFF